MGSVTPTTTPQHRRRKRIGATTAPDPPKVDAPDLVWVVDFQFDATTDGRLINDVKVRVRIELHAGPVPQPSAQGSTETPVADRPTVTTPLAVIAGTGICELSTQHISFTEIPEYPAIVEIATIHTELRDDEDCTDATTLATAAWRTLPTP